LVALLAGYLNFGVFEHNGVTWDNSRSARQRSRDNEVSTTDHRANPAE
jgi:hypothetical protein